MDLVKTSDMSPYIDRALACLFEGVHTQAAPISISSIPAKREWTLEDLNLLQLSYEMLSQRVHRHIADAAQCLNSRTSIRRLPNEIFIKVITLALVPNDGDRKHYPWHLTSLGLVSKHWNEIIQETPSLWAQISSAYSDRENRAAVLRSQEHPLRIHHDGRDFRGRYHEEPIFLDFVTREAYRWRSAKFDIYSSHTKALLHRFVPLSVPILEELKIKLSQGLSSGGAIDIFSGGAACLRHIELSYFPIHPSSQLLSGLETLKIFEWPSDCSLPSTSEITNILRRCPNLRAFGFQLYSDRAFQVPGATPSVAEAIYLPALTSFFLNLNDPNAFRRIVSSMRIPACTSLDLSCDGPISNILANEDSHLMSVFLSIIQAIPEISLELYGFKFVLYNRNDNDINITFWSGSPWEDLAWLIKHTTGSVAWPPIDATTYDSLPFSHGADLLQKLPSITNLTLGCDSERYITLLSHPTLNNGIHEWVLPNLRELSLEDRFHDSQQILEDLSDKRQQGADMDRGDGVLLGLPMKLGKIRV
ncbi:hypothetical protein FRB95_009462 [Tulasnella sp. JGI-2019a]|nr:hypothetical protein FRB93_009165 [Tulasnella sp. JGI-2019a]KAG9026059.1 hypothetical protein FRB95_009462 [Tulasnella sp. JGI-2019a]